MQKPWYNVPWHISYAMDLGPKLKQSIVGLYISHRMELYDNVSRMNYSDLGLEDVNGKQGGAFNAHWKEWQPSLGIGSMMGFGHSHLGCLHSGPA